MPALTKALLGREEVALRWRLALAEYIRDARVAAGLTQSDLADHLDLNSKQFVSGIETGRTSVPPERLEAFAEALSIDKVEFAKVVLRYSNPWMFAALFGADKQLRAELASTPDRVNIRRGPRQPHDS
jgi:transcriptional regulator with XRE-family HTH domain